MKDKSKKLAVINTGRKPQIESGGTTTTVVHAGIGGGGGGSMNLSDYLLKQIWDKAFEIRVTETGEEYLFGKLNFATQYGITMYANGGLLDLPNIFEGIPFDNKTIWQNPETKLVEVIGSTEEDEGGSADFNNVKESGEGNSFTSFILSEDGKKLTFVKGETFAKQSDFAALNTKVADFLEGSDTDNIINKWKELEAFLSGMKESDELSDILSEKADWGTTLAHYGITDAYTKTQVETLLEDYLPLAGGTITGDLRLRKGSEYTSPYLYFGDSDEVWMKEATDTHLTIHADGSVKIDSPKTVIDGIEIKKSASGVLFIDANLVVSGGITMYGTDGTTANTIWNDAPIASTSVKGIASFDSEFFAVNNGKVTFIGSTGGGGIESITKKMVIDALGFTPYDEDNPDGFITSSGTANKANSLTTARTISLTGQATGSTTFDGSTNKSIAVTIPTRSVRFNGTKYTVLTNSDTTSDMPNIYAADCAGIANQVCVSGGSGNAPSWVNQSSITSGACSGNAATATTATNAKKVLLTGSASNGNYRIVFSDVSAGTSENNSLYVDSANEGARYNPNTNQLTCLTYMSGASGYYIYNTDYRVYANNNEFILNTPAYFSLRMSGSTKLYMNNSGWFGIGTTSPESKFHVAGSVQADNTLWLTNNDDGSGTYGLFQNGVMILRKNSAGDTVLSAGNGSIYFRPKGSVHGDVQCYITTSGNLLTTGGITMYSDLRKKTILNHVELSLKEVADAPLIEHYYNSDEKKTTHVGSVAQYWAELNDWFCKEDEEGFLTMEIQNAALASAISVARELTRYESKTDKQIKKLKKRIGELEEEIENLKKM